VVVNWLFDNLLLCKTNNNQKFDNIIGTQLFCDVDTNNLANAYEKNEQLVNIKQDFLTWKIIGTFSTFNLDNSCPKNIPKIYNSWTI
jgi:hypothetical protein